MSGHKNFFLIGWAILCLTACRAGVGDGCHADKDCPSGLCLNAKQGYTDGYCSADCAAAPCGEDESCQPVGDLPVCLLKCADRSACRSGYQCYQGVCQPNCTSDDSCGNKGYICKDSVCIARPGAKLGASCNADGDCSSDACIESKCVELCDRDADCSGGGTAQTCVLDRSAQSLRSYCVPRRGGAAPLAGCTDDTQCDRGSCLMGACLLLCRTSVDCGGTAGTRACNQLPAPLGSLSSDMWPAMRACLPRNQDLTVDLSRDKVLLVPDTARSVALFTSVTDYSQNQVVGMGSFHDPSGKLLYQIWDQNNPEGYFTNPIRHQPDLGCSTFLFSGSPMRAPVALGAYAFTLFTEDALGNPVAGQVQAVYKLYDAPLDKGSVPLRIHVTDLSGLPAGCSYRGMQAADAPRMLSVMLDRLKSIYQQDTLGVTFDPITFVDSDAPSSANVTVQGSLGGVLEAATQDSTGGVDLVLLRSISPNGVLGVAGGIPASPGIKGTPHTGAVASIGVLCIPQYDIQQTGFAVTVAHELGHTLGLSHNREMDDHSDPLGDGVHPSESYLQDTDNLMYWAEGLNPGTKLTKEQGQVVRSMPQVHP